MNTSGIIGFGSYIPRMRLSRKSIAQANAWANPGLVAYGESERSVCNIDEDCVTMAVEAGRNCLHGGDRKGIDSLCFSSTTMPFADRQNSVIVAEALGLRNDITSLDISNSQRSSTSGLIVALRGIGQSSGSTLYVAADNRNAKSASSQELLFGDGAAALALGNDNVLAKFLGDYSLTCDFIDHFRGERSKYDTHFEQRWVRDEGYMKLVPKAIQGLLEKAGVTASELSHFIMPCIIRGVRETVAKKMGIRPEAIGNDLSRGCGETGTAHPLLMLNYCLEEAKPKEKILVVGFGQGVDVLLFETADRLGGFSPRYSIKNQLNSGFVETNYQKFLSMKDLVEIDWGLRAESEPKIRPTAAGRKHRHLNGFIGGRCTQCGTVQFPMAHFCVNPECREKDTQEEYRLADSPAKVASFTVDRLAYSPNPPLLFGMIEFEAGAKLIMEFTDCNSEEVEVGLPMEMVFRIKRMDKERNFRSYFWKAAPQHESDIKREG